MRLALGTAQFGMNYGVANQVGKIEPDEARAIMEYANSSGINTLDTAIAYGDSEEQLGNIGVENWQIVTKLPAIPEKCHDIGQWISESINESLGRLGVARIHGLLLHRPQQLLEAGGESLYHALQKQKSDGLVEKIGVSIYGPEELNVIIERYQLDIVQAPFNILDRRLIEADYLTYFYEHGIELHARSTFLQGLLLLDSSERLRKFKPWSSLWLVWDKWLADAKLTPLEACLRYVFSFSEIDKIIIGIDSLRQLKEILQVSEDPLPEIPDSLHTSDVNLLNPARWVEI